MAVRQEDAPRPARTEAKSFSPRSQRGAYVAQRLDPVDFVMAPGMIHLLSGRDVTFIEARLQAMRRGRLTSTTIHTPPRKSDVDQVLCRGHVIACSMCRATW